MALRAAEPENFSCAPSPTSLMCGRMSMTVSLRPPISPNAALLVHSSWELRPASALHFWATPADGASSGATPAAQHAAASATARGRAIRSLPCPCATRAPAARPLAFHRPIVAIGGTDFGVACLVEKRHDHRACLDRRKRLHDRLLRRAL